MYRDPGFKASNGQPCVSTDGQFIAATGMNRGVYIWNRSHNGKLESVLSQEGEGVGCLWTSVGLISGGPNHLIIWK